MIEEDGEELQVKRIGCIAGEEIKILGVSIIAKMN